MSEWVTVSSDDLNSMLGATLSFGTSSKEVTPNEYYKGYDHTKLRHYEAAKKNFETNPWFKNMTFKKFVEGAKFLPNG